MRPLLMIENLKNLHDARYCAAVGISMASFDMAEGSEGALSAPKVKEIIEWLSGMECIGKFGHDSAASINEIAQQAGLSRVQLPANYQWDQFELLPPNFILDASQDNWSPEVYGSLRAFADAHPDTLFLLHVVPGLVSTLAHFPDFLSRCILRIDDPNATFQELKAIGLQPFGFSLGAFSIDPDGQLDYDACDQFIEEYEGLVPA